MKIIRRKIDESVVPQSELLLIKNVEEDKKVNKVIKHKVNLKQIGKIVWDWINKKGL